MIEELTIRGFKSYRAQQKVRFTRGVNKISGRNASGKTTLLEAILFGLFGDVPGVEKKDLLSVTGEGLYVGLTIRTPKGIGVRIHREAAMTGRGGDEKFKMIKVMMEVEGEKTVITRERDASEKLRELLGISSGTFFNVVYARQKEFVDILNPDRGWMNAILGLTTPSEIREELKEVRQLLTRSGKIDEKSTLEERAKNAEQTLSEDKVHLENEKSRRLKLSRELEEKRVEHFEARSRVESAESLLLEFRRLESLRNDVEVTRRQREDRSEEYQGLLMEIGDEPERRRSELSIEMDRAQSLEERLRRLLDDELSAQKIDLKSNIDRLIHQINEHSELQAAGLTICPKCGQKIDYILLEEELGEWTAQRDEKQGKLTALDREIRDIQNQVKVAREKANQKRDDLNNFMAYLTRIDGLRRTLRLLEDQAQSKTMRLETELVSLFEKYEKQKGFRPASLEDGYRKLDEALQILRKEAADAQAEVKSRTDRLTDSERIIRDIETRLRGIEDTRKDTMNRLKRISEYEAKVRALDSISERYVAYERDLRENTLRLLEYKTFEYFRRLTDQQLYSNCHIERERYTLEVQPRGSPRPLPAWRTGGGHESLFALAERLALLRVRNFPHLLILDEPTDAVDSENVPHLLEYIARSSREIGQVLLVTHHGQGEEEGVHLIRVRKTDSGSQVYQEGSTNI